VAPAPGGFPWRVGDRERELLRKEVFLVEQRRQDTDLRLKALAEKQARFLEAEARRFAKVKREREDDDDPTAAKRARLQSLVALPGGGGGSGAAGEVVVMDESAGQPLGPRPRRLLKIADTQRDRKLMGFVLGHLNKFKQELAAPGGRVEVFREKIKHVEDKLVEDREAERAKAKAQIAEDLRKQEELQARLTRRFEQLRKAHGRILVEEREFLLAHFLETKAQPKLYFLPSHHTPETRRRWEERKGAATAKYQEFRRTLDALVADVEQNSIEKILPAVSRGGLGKGLGPGGRLGGIGYLRPGPAATAYGPGAPLHIGAPPGPARGRRPLREERDDEREDGRGPRHDGDRDRRHRRGDPDADDGDIKPPLVAVKEEHRPADAADDDDEGVEFLSHRHNPRGRRHEEDDPREGSVEERSPPPHRGRDHEAPGADRRTDSAERPSDERRAGADTMDFPPPPPLDPEPEAEAPEAPEEGERTDAAGDREAAPEGRPEEPEAEAEAPPRPEAVDGEADPAADPPRADADEPMIDEERTLPVPAPPDGAADPAAPMKEEAAAGPV